MADFKVGGKVVCIEGRTLTSTLGLVVEFHKDQCYNVSDLNICKCGTLSLWLGDINNVGMSQFSKCGDCRNLIQTQKVFVLSKFFVPLDDFKEVTFEKLLEEMPIGVQ